MKKYKMENKTTEELREIIQNPAKAQQHAAAIAEVFHADRRYKDGDPDTTPENRGGIRPIRITI